SPSLSSRSTVSVLNRRLRPDSSSSSRSTKQSRSRLKTSNVESSARITTFPDTHKRSMCSSLYESHNSAITHFL
ncbi:unnamed protein product, partial [Brassica rapa subsp. narinosa]